MPFYNSERYLDQAIESVLAQSFGDLELILVDDGSTDESLTIARGYERDKRIVLISGHKNEGSALALRRCLAVSSGTHIARHDADDWSAPDRFEKQLALLDAKSHISLCGSYATEVLADETQYIVTRKKTDPEIKVDGLFRIPMLTSTTMGRAAFFRRYGCEDISVRICGDYLLFAKYLEELVFENIQEPLMYKRAHADSVTHKAGWEEALRADNEARRIILQKMGITADSKTLRIHNFLLDLTKEERSQRNLPVLMPQDKEALRGWIDRLIATNHQEGFFDQATLRTALEERYRAAAESA